MVLLQILGKIWPNTWICHQITLFLCQFCIFYLLETGGTIGPHNIILCWGAWVWWFKCVAEVHLFYIIWDCIDSKFFHSWFHIYLSHGIIYHMVPSRILAWYHVGVWIHIRECKIYSTANYPFIVIPHYSGETAQYKLMP